MRQRKVRKKRRKTLTADEMRSSVSFQSGLTPKAKLALAGVIVFGLAATVAVMMMVYGSFSLGRNNGEDNPMNSTFKEDQFENGSLLPSDPSAATPGRIDDIFQEKPSGSLPEFKPESGRPPQTGTGRAQPLPALPASPKPKNDLLKENPFEE